MSLILPMFFLCVYVCGRGGGGGVGRGGERREQERGACVG
jgi:hypothetical protein